MGTPIIGQELRRAFDEARAEATGRADSTVRLEDLLRTLTRDERTASLLVSCGADLERLRRSLEDGLPTRPPGEGSSSGPAEPGIAVERVLQRAAIHTLSERRKTIEGRDAIFAILQEDGSPACSLLHQEGVTLQALLARTDREGA